jgi:Cdc6-like AAA superfamily ATPase
MFERFTDRARKVVVLAQEEARMLNHKTIGTEHILLGLIHEGEGVAAKALESLGISLEAVRQQVEEIIGLGQEAQSGHIPFTPRAKKVLEFTLQEALQLGHNYIGTEHILLGLIREGEGVAAQVLVKLGADLNRARQQVIQLLPDYQGKEPLAAGTAPSTFPLFDQLGRNLTQEAREGKLDPAIGREKEIERVIQVLSRRNDNCPVLVGEPGVGKSAVVDGVAQKIVKGEVPEILKRKQLYAFDLRSPEFASQDQVHLEELWKKVLNEIGSRSDIILFIDELHTLVGAGAAEGAIDAASGLKAMIARGELQIVGATTLDEYRKYLEKDAALERRLQPIQVAEPTISATIELLKGLRDRYEAFHRLSITDDALVAAAQLADSYIDDHFLPGKAIDLIDEAGARMRTRQVTAPPELREDDEKIAQVRREKESAIDSQDFDKAAALRDMEKQLIDAKDAHQREWKGGDMDLVVEVNEELIAEVVADLSGVPIHRIIGQNAGLIRVSTSEESHDIDFSQRYALLNDEPAYDTNNDLLGIAENAGVIASILATSRSASPFVMAIDGGWGIGKSTLLRQIESHLINEPGIVSVRFNAWTAQGGSALEGLIKSVLGQLDRNVLRRSMRRLAKQRGVISITRIFTMAVARFLGVTRLVDEMWSTLAIDVKSRNEMRDVIGKMLSDWMDQSSLSNRSLVVFIDDLDRCADEVIIQVCEAVKLYLDAPGLIFVLACDLSVLARGAATTARGGVGEGRAYLEKIIQVAYRVPPPDEAGIRKLILGYGERSGFSDVLDEMITDILVERAGRNPRKIKRIINSFVLEYQVNPAWRKLPLDSSLLVIAVLIQHLYTPFYEFLVSDESGDDPIGVFLDYAAVRAKASTPPPSDHPWWAIVRRTFQEYRMPPPDRYPGSGEKLMEEVMRLEGVLPEDFPVLARNGGFVALLRSIGDKETRQALRAQLISSPLAVESVENEVAPAAGRREPSQEERQNRMPVEST